MHRIKTIILGAAGRDFHNFNTVYRDNDLYDVVAFTATQIPDIAGRKYPASLAGKLYPKGIPIHDEADFVELVKKHKVEEVVFAYSDVPYNYVMSRSAMANAAGAHFKLLGAEPTMLKSTKPVISVCAVRTGSGKSQTSRRIAHLLQAQGLKVAAIRHPMPYGDLAIQACQRFAAYSDLDKHKCTIEEREEYEPHIDNGFIIYSGVDYEQIVREAEKEADVILWDGGNNDTPFYACDLHIVIADPLRTGHEMMYHPGEANFRRADVIVINKCDSAKEADIVAIEENAKKFNPKAVVIRANSPVTTEKPELVKGKKALVIEDGPTLTHGSMSMMGAGVVAAKAAGAASIVDPTPYAVASIAATYKKYPNAQGILPAMGYGDQQVKDLEKTIDATPCDIVVSGTPIDITRVLKVNKPMVRATYELAEQNPGQLAEAVKKALKGSCCCGK